MNYPSVKTLSSITSYPKELRKVLECQKSNELLAIVEEMKPFGTFPGADGLGFTATRHWIHSCYNPPSCHDVKMSMADELCETYGVEYTESGHNAKSPAIEYLNSGDTYAATLLWVNGRYRVGCWGDIVERGDYD